MSFQTCPHCNYAGFIDFVCPMCGAPIGDYVHEGE